MDESCGEAAMKTNNPWCKLCEGSGRGYTFPLWPKSDYEFGSICVICDDLLVKENVDECTG